MAGDLDTPADHGVGDGDGAQQRAEVVALGEEMLAAAGSVGGKGELQIAPGQLGRRRRRRYGIRGGARSGIRLRIGRSEKDTFDLQSQKCISDYGCYLTQNNRI